jgi:microcystin-dependent protein
MAEPFIGEIKLLAFGFAPKGYAACNGQLLSIAQNQALFSLLGTTYGGNGQTTFALPDIRSRVLVGMSSSVSLGQVGGESTHTLTNAEIPSHVHSVSVSSTVGTVMNPSSGYYAVAPGTEKIYSSSGADSSAFVLGVAGGNQPHSNMQPSLVMNYSIALVGIFPSRN